MPLVLLVVGGFLVVRALGGGGSSSGVGDPAAAPEMELVARPSRSLPSPISGEAATVVPAGALIVGGLDSSETSVEGVFLLGRSGKLQPAGSLAGGQDE